MFHSVHGIVTKLGTKHVVYLELATFTSNNDVYVNSLESVFFDMYLRILQNRT